MLQLFGSGLIAFWLNTVGIHVRSVDALDLLASLGSPGLILASDPNPAGAAIQQYLQALAAAEPSMSQGVWIQSGPILLANHQGTVPLPAASLTKIATSLAALKAWGPQHQFETLIGATGPIKNGILQGDLVISGSGDPLFVWEEAIALGNSLNQIGIKRITGNLIVTGNFMMNYNFNPLQAGELLKQGLDAQLWSTAAAAQYLKMPPGTLQPQVAISGSVQVAQFPIPKQILLLRHHSLPLAKILKEMNIYSNNDIAQMLADNLGGAQVVQQQAALAAGVPQSEIQLANGSGLGVENRISPRAVCAMFMAIQRETLPYKLSVADLFPVSGRDHRGTLQTRHIPAATVIKTGTLRDVSALAGVMPTRDRGLVWFAILNRGEDVASLRLKQDQLLQRLAQQWQVAPIPPTTLRPQSPSNTPASLGEISRNEILYRG